MVYVLDRYCDFGADDYVWDYFFGDGYNADVVGG